MVVAMALGMLLSILLFQALNAAIRLTSKSSQRSKAQLEATVVWNTLVNDLQASSTSQMVAADLPAPGQAVLLPQLDGVTASGTREWSKTQVLLHWDGPKKILERRLLTQPVVDPANPLPGLLILVQAPTGRSDRLLSNCMKNFHAALSNPISLELTFEVAPGRELRLAGSIGARN